MQICTCIKIQKINKWKKIKKKLPERPWMTVAAGVMQPTSHSYPLTFVWVFLHNSKYFCELLFYIFHNFQLNSRKWKLSQLVWRNYERLEGNRPKWSYWYLTSIFRRYFALLPHSHFTPYYLTEYICNLTFLK